MSDRIWYLGPLGDLRPLPAPEKDVSMPVTRYGGIHQALSGARTVDNAGFRQDFEFSLEYLSEAELAWVRALYFRHIPGPFRLINPLKKNRLTPEASMCLLLPGTGRGATVASGVGTRLRDWPSGAGPITGTSTKWSVQAAANQNWTWDPRNSTPVFAGESVVASVWVKADAAVSHNLSFSYYDMSGVQLGSADASAIAVTTSWQKFTKVATVPAGAAALRFALTNTGIAPVYLAAAQVEADPGTGLATDWEMGGGAPTVIFDQNATTSPYYPLSSDTVTLLEA